MVFVVKQPNNQIDVNCPFSFSKAAASATKLTDAGLFFLVEPSPPERQFPMAVKAVREKRKRENKKRKGEFLSFFLLSRFSGKIERDNKSGRASVHFDVDVLLREVGQVRFFFRENSPRKADKVTL